MAKYAISREGADAMRKLSQDILAAVSGVQTSTKGLKNQISGLMDGIGIYGVDIWAMTMRIDGIIEDKQEDLKTLANSVQKKSGQIDELVNMLTGGASSGGTTASVLSPSLTLAGVRAGPPKSFKDADTGHVNPNYGRSIGYSTNCQSCVVVFEARQRGYDVQVLANLPGSVLEKLSGQTNLAWIDPATGRNPEYVYDNSIKSADAYVDYIDKTVKQGNRYTIQFLWEGRNAGGHIVNLDRNEHGQLRIKDNQRGPGERSEWIGSDAIIDYFSDVQFRDYVPHILRIDNLEFNPDIANQIMEGSI